MTDGRLDRALAYAAERAAYLDLRELDGPLAAQDGPGATGRPVRDVPRQEPATGVPVAMHEELRALVGMVAGLWGHLDARLDQLEAQVADALDACGVVIVSSGTRGRSREDRP